jgi:para-aminobenzoate synthetase
MTSSTSPSADITDRLIARHLHLRSVRADSAVVFATLFGDAREAFWLDSSSAALSPRVSRCSSEDLSWTSTTSGTSTHHAEPTTQPGRLSLMGDVSGPRAELVSYDVKRKLVSVRSGAPKASMREFEDTSIFTYLQQKLRDRHVELPPSMEQSSVQMNGGYVGYCGYEAKSDVAGVLPNTHDSPLPDAWFVFADRVLVFDHADRSVHLIAIVGLEASAAEEDATRVWFAKTSKAIYSIPAIHSDGGFPSPPLSPPHGSPKCREPLRFHLERGRASYEADVARCLELISEGESYEICLTNRLRTNMGDGQHIDSLAVYRTLRLINPAPYAAYLRLGGDVAVCCSSPERFLRVRADRSVESKPIKGTRPRGSSLEDDKLLAEDLRTSLKDRSENLMIVDLVRNDLGRTCHLGSVGVPILMEVETYASVHQLVSTVCGDIADCFSVVDCIREAYPMGSMTGAPKVRTMSLIDQLETSARGIYSGTIGYLSLCGAVDLNVVIRTAVVSGSGIEIGIGGAIVALSDPRDEFLETLVKGKPLMRAVALSTTGREEYVVDNEDE